MLTEVDDNANMALSWFLSKSKVGLHIPAPISRGFRCILALLVLVATKLQIIVDMLIRRTLLMRPFFLEAVT
jgi:hypothetical protein